VRIQPRQQILDIWRSVIQSSFKDGVWQWGPKEERNSIRDAEQVLCLLYPATELPNLALDRPDSTAEDVVKALAPLGRPTAIAMKVIEVLADYIDEYTDDDGEPVFSGGSYLRTRNASDGKGGRSKGDVISEEQRSLEVVDSYSMSVTLCLATLGFISVFHTSVRKPTTQQFIGKLEKAVRDRLTAAMVGLLRSFVVNIVDENDSAREVMLRTVSPTRIQDQVQEQAVIAGLNERLSRVRARLRDDVRLGVGEDVKEGLRHESMLFECGWGWGIVQNATPFKIELSYTGFTDQPKICSVDGVADARPYLYSTVVALDGINDLLSARTRELGLLNEDQRRLSDALQVRWDQTQRYWSTIARFGEGDWPLEDIPWRTSDGDENSYYSLVVSSVLVQDLENREATDDDLNRAVAVFSALGARGRITRRVTVDDAGRRDARSGRADEPGRQRDARRQAVLDGRRLRAVAAQTDPGRRPAVAERGRPHGADGPRRPDHDPSRPQADHPGAGRGPVGRAGRGAVPDPEARAHDAALLVHDRAGGGGAGRRRPYVPCVLGPQSGRGDRRRSCCTRRSTCSTARCWTPTPTTPRPSGPS
jgi:hypothetical protein